MPVAVGHAGRWLVDSQGRVLLLHGVNISGKVVGPLQRFQPADAAYLAKLGFTVARVAFTFKEVMPEPGKIDPSFMQILTRVVDLLAARHISVLLDMHQDQFGTVTGGDGFPSWAEFTDGQPNPNVGFPAGYFKSAAVQTAFQNFWADKKGPGGIGIQERYIDGLKAVAAAFRHNSMLLGYDLFNEPWEGWHQNELECESASGCPSLEQSLLGPFYLKAAKAMRSVDPKHLVFVEPFLTFDYDGSSSLPAYGQPMNAISFHPYVMSQVPKAIDLADTNGDALLVTEFGASTSVPTIESEVANLDGAQLPWVFWDYEGHASSAQRQAMQTLAEPYPLAVAGSPTGYGFDWASKSFHLTYTTTPVPGDHLARGAQTVVEIPPGTYPDGYTVSAQGAVVTSVHCSSQLTLRANAALVTVTVSPGGGC